jgi:hypothetical protein
VSEVAETEKIEWGSDGGTFNNQVGVEALMECRGGWARRPAATKRQQRCGHESFDNQQVKEAMGSRG